jgi:hypothetical protein
MEQNKYYMVGEDNFYETFGDGFFYFLFGEKRVKTGFLDTLENYGVELDEVQYKKEIDYRLKYFIR